MLFYYLGVFVVGSVLGYFLELFYRKFKENKWIKPGVFKGIYLPLYGIGLCICYFVYNLDIFLLFKILIAIVLLTFIELLCGLIFIKYYKIPLWDYSNEFLNYKGVICFKFSVIWGILSLVSIVLFFPCLSFNLFNELRSKVFILIFLVLMFIDVLITFYKLNKNNYKY